MLKSRVGEQLAPGDYKWARDFQLGIKVPICMCYLIRLRIYIHHGIPHKTSEVDGTEASDDVRMLENLLTWFHYHQYPWCWDGDQDLTFLSASCTRPSLAKPRAPHFFCLDL